MCTRVQVSMTISHKISRRLSSLSGAALNTGHALEGSSEDATLDPLPSASKQPMRSTVADEIVAAEAPGPVSSSSLSGLFSDCTSRPEASSSSALSRAAIRRFFRFSTARKCWRRAPRLERVPLSSMRAETLSSSRSCAYGSDCVQMLEIRHGEHSGWGCCAWSRVQAHLQRDGSLCLLAAPPLQSRALVC